ncbi:Transmembrane and ubiquitin-like domain-containing protein 1 [Bulinus truncatus]|nr:Transmembrane and ubiquitin-like domain-containing protein 1 [Bulinus truncatus]
MPWIEGIGDEVTIILGLFVIGIVLMLAWISTHTADIPLLRDVGVIVVELTQRRGRPQNEEAAASVSDFETANVAERVIESDNQDNQGENTTTQGTDSVDFSQNESQNTLRKDDSERKQSTGANDFTESASHEQVAETFECNQSQAAQNADDVSSCLPETQSFIPRASAVVEETQQGNLHQTSDEHLADEDIRQRRVQYFNTAYLTSQLGTQSSNQALNDSNDPSIPETSLRKNSGSLPLTGSNLESHSTDVINASSDVSTSNQDGSVLQETQNVQEECEATPVSRIRVKLKYMNETQRLVYADPFDTIGDFRRNHFQSELQDNKWVRFIYNGQDLRDDGRTLQACNIADNCTMHCLITSQTQANATSSESHEAEEDSFMGALMYPLFAFGLLMVWQYFSGMSTFCLIGITFLLILSYVSTLRSSEQRPPQPATQNIRNRETQNHQHVD